MTPTLTPTARLLALHAEHKRLHEIALGRITTCGCTWPMCLDCSAVEIAADRAGRTLDWARQRERRGR